MHLNRRHFNLGATGSLVGLALTGQTRAQDGRPREPETPAATRPAHRFFKHPLFEVTFLTSLGRAYHSGGDVGKVLYLMTQVEDGNFETAYQAFKKAGDQARELARDSEQKR